MFPHNNERNDMKTRDELQEIIEIIKSEDSPVGMDAVYVHALIIDKLTAIENRLSGLEAETTD
jgi:hypothetical protein